MDRGRLVHGQDAKNLHALRAVLRLADDARALEGGLQTAATQNGHMQKNVRRAIVRNDKAIAFGDVEPFDASRDLYKIKRFFPIGGGCGAELVLKRSPSLPNDQLPQC